MRCRGCSKGCSLDVIDGRVIGGLCAKGPLLYETYGTQDQDIYKYYLPVKNGYMKHILIVSDQPIAYDYFKALDACMETVSLEAPIEKDQIILVNPLGLPVCLKAARLLKRRV